MLLREYRNDENKLHCENGPAVEYCTGNKSWYVNGKRHRLDGPAIEHENGESWYVNGKRHRVDGPAVVHNGNGYESWWLNGKHHRDNGPAVLYANGNKEWWYHGKRMPGPIVRIKSAIK